MIPLLLAPESIETSGYALAFGMVSHVEMAPAAGACTGAAGFKLFGKVITQQQPTHASTEATGSPPSPPIFSSGRGGVDQQEAAARARAAAAEARLPCPRCWSRDTKFCYFNNYNVNQPRHFCRACHRYWTAGGVLRNVPVGSGRRKNRPAPHSAATSSADHRSEGSVSPGLKIGFPPDHGWSHAAPSPPAPYTGHGVMELYRWLVRTERPPFGSDRAL